MSALAAVINTKTTETIPVHKRRPWGTKYIKVVNKSNCGLVLSFVHEHRLQLKRQEKITERGATASANAGGVGLDGLVEGNVGMRFSHREVNIMFSEGEDCMVDQRVLIEGEACKVHFLPGCKEVRVRGYYLLPFDDPKPLVFWKNSTYSRSVRITATVKKDRSMEVPKEVEIGRLEQLPIPSLLVAGGVVLSVAVYFIVPAVC